MQFAKRLINTIKETFSLKATHLLYSLCDFSPFCIGNDFLQNFLTI